MELMTLCRGRDDGEKVHRHTNIMDENRRRSMAPFPIIIIMIWLAAVLLARNLSVSVRLIDHIMKATVYREDSPAVLLISNENNDKNIHETKEVYPFFFSGCLLVKDDNIILPEWLAYHYTTLPLRHLVIAIDPLSKTFPSQTIERYRDLGMEIIVWTGHSYWKDDPGYAELKSFDPQNHTVHHAHIMHQNRQVNFLTVCMEYHKQMNRTWTVLVDTDEYVNYNSFVESETARDTTRINCLVEWNQNSDICMARAQIRNGTHMRSFVPRQIGRQNETIAHWIASGRDLKFVNQTKSCVVFPRVTYGGQNSTNPAIPLSVPGNDDGVDYRAFHTLQFIRHGPKRGGQPPLPGKSLMDARHYPTGTPIKNPHRPLGKHCANGVFPEPTKYSLRINHYTGSYESFMASSYRRTLEKWEERNNYQVQDEDTSMLHWFHEFVLLVGGIERAKQLTQELREAALREAGDIQSRLQRGEIVPPYKAWNEW